MKRKERILLICNGEAPSRSLLRRLAREADLVVAADGGANAARQYAVRPDVIIGDLDSARAGTLRQFRKSTILRVSRQDNTDLEKALDYLSAHAGAAVAIVGATGGRIDFTLANLSVFWNYIPGLDIRFLGDSWQAMPVRGTLKLRARVGTTVSLVPFTPCSGITLRGLKYGLHNAEMRPGEIGVSNVAVARTFGVQVLKGRMLLVIFARTGRATGHSPW
ncbi:MAG TPA: thiamine diphosphokinase [Bacteroidota bacterium]|nr:thiamine diphosphokinase [Bacteroidota bacterium]